MVRGFSVPLVFFKLMGMNFDIKVRSDKNDIRVDVIKGKFTSITHFPKHSTTVKQIINHIKSQLT